MNDPAMAAKEADDHRQEKLENHTVVCVLDMESQLEAMGIDGEAWAEMMDEAQNSCRFADGGVCVIPVETRHCVQCVTEVEGELQEFEDTGGDHGEADLMAGGGW